MIDPSIHVAWIDDPGDVLGGQVSLGQVVNGSYSYETTVPDQNPNPIDGEYLQSPAQGSTSFAVGPFTFATDPTSPGWLYRALVHSDWNPGYQDSFRLLSSANKPLATGASVLALDIDFSDFSGAALSSDALLASAPNLESFPQSSVRLSGYSATGTQYTLQLQIDSVQVADAGLSISPSSSSFVRPQHVDPALILEAGSQVMAVQGSVNGIPLPAEYLGQCRYASPNAQHRPAIHCPDINPFLVGGTNQVEWRAQLPDGSALTKVVDWEMIQ